MVLWCGSRWHLYWYWHWCWYWQPASGSIWDHPVASGNIWQHLAPPGSIWQHLGWQHLKSSATSSGSILAYLPASGSIWQHLATSGNIWWQLGSSSINWHHLAASGLPHKAIRPPEPINQEKTCFSRKQLAKSRFLVQRPRFFLKFLDSGKTEQY